MKFDVAIVGGGVVGAALARSLAPSRLATVLVEPRPPRPLPAAGFDVRIYALNARSRELLERVGAWRHLVPDRAAPVLRMRVFGDDDSAIDFDAYESHVGELATIVEEANLQQALRVAMRGQENLTVLADACAGASWTDGPVILELAGGGRIEAALVVAADGSESALRGWAGIEASGGSYGECGVVANFRVEKPHGGTAYQWFLPEGVIALLPMPDDHVSMVWSVADALAETLVALPPADLAGRVESATRSRLGGLVQVGEAARFPLRRMRAARLIGPRLALVGDTAHNVHPLAGQGLNLGLADVRSLAGILISRGLESDSGAPFLLRKYERSRREELLAMEAVTHGLHGLFHSTVPAVKRLRNAGLNLVNRVSPLKRLLARHAMG